MEYLFFDVECANCFNGTGKLCEFGYVLTDEQFNIIKKQSILINPADRFDPYVIKKMLNFTEDEYKANPKFNVFYGEIIGLITAEDRLVIGHTVGGDAKYVGADCMRYKLDPPDFEHIDIVEIHKGLNEQKDATSLVKMSEVYGVEVPEDVHSALVDAMLTMLCAKAMVKTTGLILSELVEKYPRAKGRLVNYKQEYLRKKLYRKFLLEMKKKGVLELNSEQKKTLNEYRRIARADGGIVKSVLNGKRVCISYNYECYNYKNMLKIIKLLADRGAKCISRATKCDVFVRYDIKYSDGLVYCQRLEQAEIAVEDGKRIKFMDFNSFMQLLGVTEGTLSQMPDVDAEKVVAEHIERAKQKTKRYYKNINNNRKKIQKNIDKN